jgi:hypothetical protein
MRTNKRYKIFINKDNSDTYYSYLSNISVVWSSGNKITSWRPCNKNYILYLDYCTERNCWSMSWSRMNYTATYDYEIINLRNEKLKRIL